MPAFDRYIGIDYSGAETPTVSLKGRCCLRGCPPFNSNSRAPGQLWSYAPDFVDQNRRLTRYVDRILKGAKMAPW